MPTIDTLIGCCIDLEGVLRVLRERDSAEARSRLEAAVDTLTYRLDEYFAEQAALDYATVSDEEQPVQSQIAEPEIPSEEPDSVTEPETVVYTEPELPAEPKEVVAPEPEVPAEPTEKTSVAEFLSNRQQAPNTRLLRAFTLNDRFRFCRTLFAGNDADFTDTLRLLADMDSYSEAEDYLLNDLLWDKSDADTADFLAILSENMPK